jgi:recombination protein RecR
VASLPEPVTQLTAALSKLPGIGPRSAERIALHLVQAERQSVQALASVLLTARERVALCEICGALTEKQPCTFCGDDRRDHSITCLVERPVDIISIEKAGVFKGTYHVLGGKISPLNGVDPDDLRIRELEQRINREHIAEIIVALPSDVEGDATTYYLNQLLRSRGVRLSRIAQGLPVGSGLEFADELTLSRALEGRNQLT